MATRPEARLLLGLPKAAVRLLGLSAFVASLAPVLAAAESAHVVDGIVTVGPTCAGPERVGASCTTPMRGAEVTLTGSDGRIQARTTADAEGRFRIIAPAGTYRLRVDTGAAKLPRCPELRLVVPLSSEQLVRVDCDSGMR